MSEIKRYKVKTDSSSRYSNNERILYDTGEEIIETSDRIEFEHSNKDSYFTVEARHEGRLDLVSYEVYGTSIYWWAIASASGIYDPFDVKVGTVLRIPPIEKVLGR